MESENLTGNALLILGAPRSGTSAVANAFRRLGFFLGDDTDFPEPKEGNPLGIFERHEFLEFNARCMDALHMRHDRPELSAMSEHPLFPTLVEEASALLLRTFAGRPLWGWKEPQTTLLAPIFQDALTKNSIEAGYLLCVRHPAEVIQSQELITDKAVSNREAPLGVRAYRRWMSYTLKSLNYSRGARRAMLVYHQLLADPSTRLLEAFASITGSQPEGSKLESAISSIRPSLHRNRVEDLPGDAPELAKEIWNLCCAAGQDPTALCNGTFDGRIQELTASYEMLSTCFGEPEPPHCSILLYVGEGKPMFASAVLATGRWNSVEIDVKAEPATHLLGMLYPMPADVYIRNPHWGGGPAKIRAAGETLETKVGACSRFSVVSIPPQITLRTPSEIGPYVLRMEVFVEMNSFITMDASIRQSQTIRNLEGRIVSTAEHAAKLESEVLRLRSELAQVRKAP